MKQIFKKIYAECDTCGTPLWGEDVDRIGDRFYCRSDYQKASAQEKNENKAVIDENDFWRRLLGTDESQLALDHDFTTGWTLTSATASSAKVWVSEAGGKISKDFNLTFGHWYRIRIVSNVTSGSIVCYNSTDATKQLGTDNFEIEFIALTDYIEFRNSSASTNTITMIELRKI